MKSITVTLLLRNVMAGLGNVYVIGTFLAIQSVNDVRRMARSHQLRKYIISSRYPKAAQMNLSI